MNFMIMRDCSGVQVTVTTVTVKYAMKDVKSFLNLASHLFNGYGGAIMAILGNFDIGDIIIWIKDESVLPRVLKYMGKREADYEKSMPAVVQDVHRGIRSS
jgi:hypothetical protein